MENCLEKSFKINDVVIFNFVTFTRKTLNLTFVWEFQHLTKKTSVKRIEKSFRYQVDASKCYFYDEILLFLVENFTVEIS